MYEPTTSIDIRFRWIIQVAVILLCTSEGISEEACVTGSSWRHTWWMGNIGEKTVWTRRYDLLNETEEQRRGETTVLKNTYICLEREFLDPYTYYVRYKAEDPDTRECVRIANGSGAPSRLMIQGVVRPVLWSCNFGFEGQAATVCDMVQNSSDDLDWQISAGPPLPPHTLSLPKSAPGHARISTPPLSYVGQTCISFFHYLKKSSQQDNITVNLLMPVGDQIQARSLWDNTDAAEALTFSVVVLDVPVTISSSRVEFAGYRDGSNGEDLAIDKIIIEKGKCVKDLFRCSFGEDSGSLCGAIQDSTDAADYTLTNTASHPGDEGPRRGYGGHGYYIFLESKPPLTSTDTARIYTPKLNYEGQVCVHFRYYMNGSEVNSLHLISWHEESEKKVLLWAKSGSAGDNWYKTITSVTLTSSGVQLGFEAYAAHTHYRGNIGVDDVYMIAGCSRRRSPDPTSLTLGQCKEYLFPIAVDIFVQMPFQFSSACPFPSGKYQLVVQIASAADSVIKFCEGDKESYVNIAEGSMAVHSCLSGNNTYDAPFSDVVLTCVEGLTAKDINSEEGNGNDVLILAYNALSARPAFYTARHTYLREEVIMMSVQGSHSGRLQPHANWSAAHYRPDGQDFVHIFIMSSAATTSSTTTSGAAAGTTSSSSGGGIGSAQAQTAAANIAPVIGGVVAGLVLLVALTVGILLYLRHRGIIFNKEQQNQVCVSDEAALTAA